MRRRLAVTTVVVTALIGEWLGHGVSYYLAAGTDGLRAGLSGGVHGYMLPLVAVLLIGALLGAAVWARAWLALGRRLDASAAALASLRRGEQRPVVPARAGTEPSPPTLGARVAALSGMLTVIQLVLYLAQENIEVAGHGAPLPGLSVLVDRYAAAAWIQATLAVMFGALLVAATAVLRRRERIAAVRERTVRILSGLRIRTPAPVHPVAAVVTALQLRFRSTLWQRPPPRPLAA
jgi:hypothetical protein